MANKKVSQLVSKPSVLVTDLFPIADPTTGQLFKTTISDLGTAIGSGVSSVNTLVGAVVLDTDDIQELASPTNRWFTDTRARAALSASSPLAYNSGTGVFSIAQANGSTNGFLSSADWTTFNAKQAALSGTGFVKISGTTISYDNSTYLTTSAAASTYLALAGGTLTGSLNGTSATFTGDLTLSASNPRLYFTDTDNNPDYFISNTDGTFTVYDVTNSTSRFTIGTTGNGTFGGNLTVGQIIRSGGNSSQFLKADGSVDSTAYVSGSGTSEYYARFTGTRVVSDGFIRTTSNITYVEGMGLYTLNGLDVNGNYGAGGGGLKIRSYDETTGNAYIDFANTGGRMYLGLNRSTASGLMTNATAYATVLTTGLGTTNLEFGTNATKRLTIDGTTGAVTLTSTISATGATLTGALSGTSATFSGNVIVNGSSIDINPASGQPNITLRTANTFRGYIEGNSAGGMSFGTGSGAAICLTLASTGAATFSSSVSGISHRVYNGATTIGYIIRAADWGDSGNNLGLAAESTLGINFYTNGAATPKATITSAGNVGIGTTAPGATLEVRPGTGANLRVRANGDNNLLLQNYNGTDFYRNMQLAGSSIQFLTGTEGGDGATERMRITSGGNVLIGTTSAIGFAMEVNGSIWTQKLRVNDGASGYVTLEMENSTRWRINYLGRFSGYGAGALTTDASGNITAASDRTLKDIIRPVENVLENIMDFEPVYFKWNEKTDLDKENVYMSTIAQSIQKHYPDAVGKMADGTLTVQDRAVTAILVQAIKELTEKVKTLENK